MRAMRVAMGFDGRDGLQWDVGTCRNANPASQDGWPPWRAEPGDPPAPEVASCRSFFAPRSVDK
jgi:hypothetical protein